MIIHVLRISIFLSLGQIILDLYWIASTTLSAAHTSFWSIYNTHNSQPLQLRSYQVKELVCNVSFFSLQQLLLIVALPFMLSVCYIVVLLLCNCLVLKDIIWKQLDLHKDGWIKSGSTMRLGTSQLFQRCESVIKLICDLT